MRAGGTARTRRAAGAYAKAALPEDAISAAAPSAATAAVLGIPEEEFTPRVRDAIVTLMHEVGRLRQELDMTRKQMEDAARHADQDMLLPILNRRAFVREINRFISFAQRYEIPSSLIYFDLNDFKLVNDTLGHSGGDKVLKAFADVIQTQIRDTDILARVGGDEFGVILAHVTVDQARKKAADLANRLETHPLTLNGSEIPVRFAYGVYELHAGESADSAMAEADRAMYEQKRAGKAQA